MTSADPSLVPFSAWSGPHQPKLLILGEAWGEQEAMARRPFVGASGQELWAMLGQAAMEIDPDEHSRVTLEHRYGAAWVKTREAWLHQASLAFTNVFNLRPPGNNIEELCCAKKDLPPGYPYPYRFLAKALYLRPEFFPHLARLEQELALARPNLVLAMGNTAIWALAQATNIGSIRGTVMAGSGLAAGLKVMATYHPAAVLRQWSWRPIVVADLMKALREAEFPEIRRPARTVLINPSLEDLRHAVVQIQRDAANGAGVVSCDIETAKGQITCISFAGSESFALTVPFVDNSHPSRSYWPSAEEEVQAWRLVGELLSGPERILGQNFIYDLQYITRMGIFPTNCVEDTMLLHHAIQPEMKKGLGFLGSIYTQEPAWKLMRRKRPDTEKRDE